MLPHLPLLPSAGIIATTCGNVMSSALAFVDKSQPQALRSRSGGAPRGAWLCCVAVGHHGREGRYAKGVSMTWYNR